MSLSQIRLTSCVLKRYENLWLPRADGTVAEDIPGEIKITQPDFLMAAETFGRW